MAIECPGISWGVRISRIGHGDEDHGVEAVDDSDRLDRDSPTDGLQDLLGRLHTEISSAIGHLLNEIDVGSAFDQGRCDPFLGVEAAFLGDIVAGELGLVHPFQLDADLIEGDSFLGWTATGQQEHGEEIR